MPSRHNRTARVAVQREVKPGRAMQRVHTPAQTAAPGARPPAERAARAAAPHSRCPAPDKYLQNIKVNRN